MSRIWKINLINGTFPVTTSLNKATTLKSEEHDLIDGLDKLDKCIDINQSPIGRTPRSNPATYTGICPCENYLLTQESDHGDIHPGDSVSM